VRRQFQLSEADEAELAARGLGWEAIVEGGTRWLLILEYPISAPYTVATATVALRLDPSYPSTQIDMAYFHPALAAKDGRAIRQLSLLQLDGRQFQQWSRHRTAQNPWRPGEDDLSTHLILIDDWLRREFERQ